MRYHRAALARQAYPRITCATLSWNPCPRDWAKPTSGLSDRATRVRRVLTRSGATPRVLPVVARNALKPGYLPEMARKLWRRVRHPRSHSTASRARSWAEARAESAEVFACSLDAQLWDEAGVFETEFSRGATDLLSELPIRLGGPGHYRLVYFLVRHLRPAAALETGVAAGFTTAAVLTALDKNGEGFLHSSDLPYFRIQDPEKYVGVVVPEHLKGRWALHLGSDRSNLPEILEDTKTFDFVHYDSDKSYEARAATMELVDTHLSPGAVIVIDDIGDNFHFRDWTANQEMARVFEFDGKFLGLVGL